MTEGTLSPGRRQCECSTCGQRFGGVVAFDAHRVGKFGVRDGVDRRRCMTTDEMLSAGLSRNGHGWGRAYSTPRTLRIGAKAGSNA